MEINKWMYCRYRTSEISIWLNAERFSSHRSDGAMTLRTSTSTANTDYVEQVHNLIIKQECILYRRIRVIIVRTYINLDRI